MVKRKLRKPLFMTFLLFFSAVLTLNPKASRCGYVRVMLREKGKFYIVREREREILNNGILA